MPSCELMAKKLDAFLLGNLVKLEPGGESLFQELQRRLLKPDQEARGASSNTAVPFRPPFCVPSKISLIC